MRVNMFPCSLCTIMVLLPGFVGSAAAHVHPPRAQLKERIEVPMDLSIRRPVIALTVNGQGPFRFVVDSGAGGTVIDDDLAEKLNLKSIGKALTGDVSGKAPKEMPLVAVERIGIGNAAFIDSIAVIGDLDAVWHDQQDGPQGVLAFSTFADCLVTFDYPNEKLVLESGTMPPADGRDILEYQFIDDQQIPWVRLKIGDTEIPVMLDTGASMAGTLAADMEGKVRTKEAPVPTGMVRRMNSATIQRDARMEGSLMLGRHQIQEPIFNFMGQRSMIGNQIFKHFAITFDQGERTVRFIRSSNDPITVESRYTAGFGAKPTAEGRVVWYALDGLPAAEAGLKEGDLIVAANGKPMSAYDARQWRTMFEQPGSIGLDVRRDGANMQITFDNLLAVQ
jgi:hypothetical protein